MLVKLPRAFQPLAIHVGSRVFGIGAGFPVEIREPWLGIKRIDMRDPSIHKAENHIFDFRAKMGFCEPTCSGGLIGSAGFAKQTRQSQQPESIGSRGKQISTRPGDWAVSRTGQNGVMRLGSYGKRLRDENHLIEVKERMGEVSPDLSTRQDLIRRHLIKFRKFLDRLLTVGLFFRVG